MSGLFWIEFGLLRLFWTEFGLFWTEFGLHLACFVGLNLVYFIAGLNNIFIVLVAFLNPLFDVKLCQDTFTISPNVHEVGEDAW